MPLAIDKRPKLLKEVHGNHALKSSLGTILKRDIEDIPHAILFCGQSGCGKTTLARIFASKLDCDENEFYELNSADVRGVDTVREISKQMKYSPMSGSTRIWLFDEVHKMTNDAQNAMLKMLEDPPAHVYFMLATTDPQKLIAPLKSRCTTFEVKPLTDDEMMEFLSQIVDDEEKDVPEEILESIINSANGSPRNALQILERIIDLPVKAMKAAAEQTAETEAQTIDLCRELLKPKPAWKDVAKILSTLTGEPESIRYAVLGYCNAILMKGDNKRAYLVMSCFTEPYFNTAKAGLTISCYEAVNGG